MLTPKTTLLTITFFLTLPMLLFMTSTAGQNVTTAGRDDTKAEVDSLLKKASRFQQLDSDSALFYAKAAFEKAKQLRDRHGQAAALLKMSGYYQSRSNFSRSMETVQEAIRLLNGEESPLAGAACLALAQVYKDLSGDKTKGYIDQCLAYARQGYQTYGRLKDTAGMANSLSTRGILFRDKARLEEKTAYYDSSFVCYSNAIALVQQSGKGRDNLAKFYNNIGQYYMDFKKDYRKAEDYLQQAVAENKRTNSVWGLSHNYANLSILFIETKELDKSLAYARQSLAAAFEAKRPTRVYFGYRMLYQTFNAAHRYDSALHYYVLATNLNDSLTNINRTEQVLDLQYRYETAKKELDIRTLSQDNAAKNRRIVLLVAALMLMALVVLGFVWLYRRLRQQKAQLAAQSKQLALTMRELHHRVKNNLQIVSSLLSLQTYKSDDEQVLTVLKESQQRVQAMSLIHQRLYKKDGLTDINMREYVTDLVSSLMASFGYDDSNFDLQLHITKEALDIDEALPLGLILNEIITNAFKYAYTGVKAPSLSITMKEDSKNVLLSVKDNGIGLNEWEWKRKSDSFGKQLITALSRQLRARQSIVVDGGTEFSFVIPPKAA